MSLVKFNTDKDLDLELEAIKAIRPDCNTNAAAAKYAILNYLFECEHKRELQSQMVDLIEELNELRYHLSRYFESESEIKKRLIP